MAKKRNRITLAMSKTIEESSPLIKKQKNMISNVNEENNILEINLNKLKANPFQPRINIDMHSLNELISSIEQNTLLQPIVITEKDENGIHTIIAGHRRTEAFKIMGKNKIKAVMLKDITEKDLAILSLTENLMRENLHPIENAIAIKNILDNNIVESQNKLAEYVGMSKGYVSKLMNILRLPSSIINIIKKDNYKDINVLILINKLNNEEDMYNAYNNIKELSRAEAERYLKNKYLLSKKINVSLIDIKNGKSKISINVNLKNLTEDQILQIKKEINNLEKNIISFSNNWKN